MPTNQPTPVTPTIEMAARAWHALSDEVLDGIGFDDAACTCRNYAPYVKKVLDLFSGQPIPEPEGLGAVVVNPFTDQVFVRAAHPALPWHDPGTASPQQWADPTREDWHMWDDLPGPLVMQSPGWTPPTAHPTQRSASPSPLEQSEPTGLGAVATDAAGHTWIRAETGQHPWLHPDPADAGIEHAADWDDLPHPVTIRTLGWDRR